MRHCFYREHISCAVAQVFLFCFPVLAGIITSGGVRMGGGGPDRCSPVAHHKSSAESVPGLAGLGGLGGLGGGLSRPYPGPYPYGPHPQARSVSRQSLLDLVGCRLGVGGRQRQHQVSRARVRTLRTPVYESE
ncbi:Myosin-1 [Frankliniella fusca]|uniref:Myosin-1 n=1 Tax=Frankliniella fusca TaxID=407009 RepID=A0AAE1GW42_9NEOP|nr:Myosin-1 [Frankliniella fusca]